MSFIARLKGLLKRGRLDRELDEELRSHVEMRTADNVAAGMSPEAARFDAQKRFGNTTLLKEDTRAVDIIGWLDECARDFRYALRMLQRSPASRPSPCSRSRSALAPTLPFFPSSIPFSSARFRITIQGDW